MKLAWRGTFQKIHGVGGCERKVREACERLQRVCASRTAVPEDCAKLRVIFGESKLKNATPALRSCVVPRSWSGDVADQAMIVRFTIFRGGATESRVGQGHFQVSPIVRIVIEFVAGIR